MRLFLVGLILSLLTLAIWFLYLKPEYRSAFEADQECHFMMSKLDVNEYELGCDHDIETKQWILFQSGNEIEKAEVLERFRY